MGEVNKIGGFRTLIIGTFGWIQEGFDWIPNPGAIQNENRALRELNLQLSNEVTRMRNSVVENNTLRALLELKQNSESELLAVSIVGLTSIQMRNYLIINKGSADGIQSGMSIRNDAGLVGVIIGISKNYSIVETIINRDVKISAKCLRSEYKGIIAWEGGEYLVMKNVPKSFDVKKGDIIITSDFSEKYPVNIPIGRVKQAKEEPGYLFLKVIVEPMVNFATLEEAFVIKQLPETEKVDLIKEIDEKLRLRKLQTKRSDKLLFLPNKKPIDKDTVKKKVE